MNVFGSISRQVQFRIYDHSFYFPVSCSQPDRRDLFYKRDRKYDQDSWSRKITLRANCWKPRQGSVPDWGAYLKGTGGLTHVCVHIYAFMSMWWRQ